MRRLQASSILPLWMVACLAAAFSVGPQSAPTLAAVSVPSAGDDSLDSAEIDTVGADTSAWRPDSSSTLLQLIPPLTDPPLEGQGLPLGEIFARIDQLDAQLDGTGGAQRAALSLRIGELYLSTEMFKHRRTALEYLDSAIALDPQCFDAYRIRAATAARMQYMGQAEKWYGSMTRTFPRHAEGFINLGRFEFLEGRKVLDRERLVRARDAYAAAVAADSAAPGGWLGLAGCQLVLGRYAAADSAALPLLPHPEFRGEALLILGAARTALRRDDDAWLAFQAAIEGLDPANRDLFQVGRGLVLEDALRHGYAAQADTATLQRAMRDADQRWTLDDGINLKKVAKDSTVRRVATEAWWHDRNPWPTHLSNRERLAYWRRLVEADLLFGDEAGGQRGWSCEPGLAWVRWGPPTETRYEAPGFGGLLDMLEGTPARGEELTQNTGYWLWIYRLPTTSFALLFRDITYHKRWVTTRNSRENLIAWGRELPLLVDLPGRREPALAVGLSTAGFQRGVDRSALETYVAVTPLAPPPARADEGRRPLAKVAPTQALPAAQVVAAPSVPPELAADSSAVVLVEVAVFDSQRRRVQYVKRALSDGARRAALMQQLAGLPSPDGDDPLLLQVQSELPPGRYEVALDVTDARDGGHQGLRSQIVLAPPTQGMLALSDLQLALAFAPCTAPGPALAEFVKQSYGIVPVPDGVLPADTRRLYVYYEVYNLATGSDGQTRFNVTYDVYHDRQGNTAERPLRSFSRSGTDRIDPLSVTYVEETSGVSSQRHVVKGGVVEIDELSPGSYVLVVSIEDQLTHERSSRFAPFRKAKARAGSAARGG